MFEQMKQFFSSNEENKQKTVLVPEPTGNTILFLYDEADRDLWYDLAPHISTLVLRMPDVWSWKYYHYTPTGEGQHEAYVRDLEKAFLFLPCTSATFLTRFLQACQKDERLRPLLSGTYVQPIPLRAAHGVTQSLLAQPLAAYPRGDARDSACVQVVATLEQKLLSYMSRQGNTEMPVALLEETASTLVVPSRAFRALH
jgi:hypothetical protein